MRVPELCETLGADVLTGMLDAGQQVGDELVDGAFVLDSSRDALCDFDLVALAARSEEVVLRSVTRQGAQCSKCVLSINLSILMIFFFFYWFEIHHNF